MNPTLAQHDVERIAAYANAVLDAIATVFVGPRQIGETVMTTVVARGHLLLEGPPGIAKTTLAKAFAHAIGGQQRRIQFTADLLPSDITGTYILDLKTNTFILREGPVFANVVLCDEINRAPAKTQAALLEAMQERQVTIEGETRRLPHPFLVIATQNPIDQHGTYPLPEAQLDRFLMKLPLAYPSAADERRMLQLYGGHVELPAPILSPSTLGAMQELADRVFVSPELYDYVIALAHFTRGHRRALLGASPRASLALLQAAKARALLRGRGYVTPDDIRELAPLVFGHRIMGEESLEDGDIGQAIVRDALSQVPYRHPAPAPASLV